jgi:hypothetical protein
VVGATRRELSSVRWLKTRGNGVTLGPPHLIER